MLREAHAYAPSGLRSVPTFRVSSPLIPFSCCVFPMWTSNDCAYPSMFIYLDPAGRVDLCAIGFYVRRLSGSGNTRSKLHRLIPLFAECKITSTSSAYILLPHDLLESVQLNVYINLLGSE